MANAHLSCMLMKRDDFPEDNHVFLHFDIISKQCSIPKISAFIMSMAEDPSFQRGLVPDCSGYHFSLPVYLAPFLSFHELQILFHFKFLESTTLSGGFQEIRQIYKDEEVLGAVTKQEAVKILWQSFTHSIIFESLSKKSPQMVMKEFEVILRSSIMLRAVEGIVEQDNVVRHILKHLSKEQLSHYLDQSVLIQENKIFSVKDPDFLDITMQLLVRKI